MGIYACGGIEAGVTEPFLNDFQGNSALQTPSSESVSQVVELVSGAELFKRFRHVIFAVMKGLVALTVESFEQFRAIGEQRYNSVARRRLCAVNAYLLVFKVNVEPLKIKGF